MVSSIAMSKTTEWNLEDLYKDLQDENLLKDQKSIERKAQKLAETYQGKLTKKTSVDELAKALKDYGVIAAGIRKIQAFAYLQYSTHSNDAAYGSFLQRMSAWTTQVHTRILFFEIELAKLPLQSKLSEKKLLPYRHFLEKLMIVKPHLLTEEQERIVRLKSLTGDQALVRLYEQEASHHVYTLRQSGKTRVVTESEIRNLFYHPDRKKREFAAKQLFEQFDHTPASRLNTYIYNMVMQDVAIDASLRSYKTNEEFRHIENEVSQETVDSLRTTVTDNYGIVHDYYRFKKDLLQVKKLYEYDRYAPIAKTTKTFTYEEAQQIIIESFSAFSPEFGNIAKEFFDKRWIDVMPRAGKQGGAYCYYVTPDSHPYILMNFTGSMNDVMTLAHELGHGIHAYLARKQHVLQFDWPLTLAETASVFAEMIVFDRLVQTLTSKKEKLALYTSKIESIFATVFRQIAMYQFERRTHTQRASEGELSEDTLNSLWHAAQQEMFGDSVTLTNYEKTYWNAIPHIYRTPFYVYAYAFGELLTLALYRIFKDNPSGFTKAYTELLQAGGSAAPHELLAKFNFDLNDAAFWQKGIDEIQSLLTEAKKFA